MRLPRRPRGRPSCATTAAYEAELDAFAAHLEEIQSTLEFRVSSRGWCYLLEEHGLGKGDFDAAQRIINELRKSGRLPLDFVIEDSAREATKPQPEEASRFSTEVWAQWRVDEILEELDGAEQTARDELEVSQYSERGYWDAQPCYIEMVVEKVDLRTLFAPVCERFHVPLVNAKGWTDIHSRAAILKRMQGHQGQGRTPVLLLCGDHDPAGLLITDAIRQNLRDLHGAHYANGERIDIDADDIVIERFGLNADFIDTNGLSWIDGLETGSGRDLSDPRHPDHKKPHVQGYIAEHGVRKCEANALVVRAEAGRELCRQAIERYFDREADGARSQSNRQAAELVVARMKEIAQERGFMVDGE